MPRYRFAPHLFKGIPGHPGLPRSIAKAVAKWVSHNGVCTTRYIATAVAKWVSHNGVRATQLCLDWASPPSPPTFLDGFPAADSSTWAAPNTT